MIPYVEPPSWNVGPLTIHAFGLLVFAAIVTGITIVSKRAARIGRDPDDVMNLAVWTVISGLVSSHVFSEIAYYPGRVAENPLILLYLWGSMSSFGGILGGLAGAWVFVRRAGFTRDETFRFVDEVAFAFPFAWIFGRAGCSLAHDHIGIATTHWLAVRFPDGPRFDLGLLELLYTIGLAALWVVLDRRRWPTGLYLGLFFTLYGPIRFFLDTLRVEDLRYLGWTPSQYLCIATTLGGIAILVLAFRSNGAITAPEPARAERRRGKKRARSSRERD